MDVFEDTMQFREAWRTWADKDEKFIVWFTGAINEQTGESWCPDCVTAKPQIDKLVEAGSRHILKGIVVRDEWMGNADHPYKKEANFKAAGVPTLILFEGENELHRVDNLDDFANDELMALFLED